MPLKKTANLHHRPNRWIHFLARHRPRLELGTTTYKQETCRIQCGFRCPRIDQYQLVPTHMFLDPNAKESDVHALLIRLWNANVYRCLCRSLYADLSLAPFWCETMAIMNLILMNKSPRCISWVCLYSSFTLPPNLSHLLKCFGRLIFCWLPGATCWREFCANPELYKSLSLKEYLPWN